jgi:hypothetical protein
MLFVRENNDPKEQQMTTITPTIDHSRDYHNGFDNGGPRTPSRRRIEARAFALGATIAALGVGGAWVTVDALHRDHPATNSAALTSATSTTSGTSASDSATGSHTSSASGSHGTTPVNPYSASIAALQRDLGQLNYYESPIDGISGPQTVAAIKDFQRANGLPVTGVADPATMAKIKQQLITGDNQMGPSGPPVKPANNTPANNASADGGNGHSTNPTGGAAAGTSTTGRAGTAA